MLYADRTENSRKIICELWRDIMTLTEEEVGKVLSFYEGLKFKEKARKGNDMNELTIFAHSDFARNLYRKMWLNEERKTRSGLTEAATSNRH